MERVNTLKAKDDESIVNEDGKSDEIQNNETHTDNVDADNSVEDEEGASNNTSNNETQENN